VPRSRYLRATVFASPGVALAILGATHPSQLTYASSAHWTVMHVIGLFIFPLVGAALVGLVWGRWDPIGWGVVVAAYLYATAYSALDLIAGVAAGFVSYQAGPDARQPAAVGDLFDVGNQLGELGVWAFLTAAVLVSVDQVRRHRIRALAPALLLVGAGISFLDSHIYRWSGVVTVLVIGLATGWFAALSSPEKSQNSRADGSSIPRSAL